MRDKKDYNPKRIKITSPIMNDVMAFCKYEKKKKLGKTRSIFSVKKK